MKCTEILEIINFAFALNLKLINLKIFFLKIFNLKNREIFITISMFDPVKNININS